MSSLIDYAVLTPFSTLFKHIKAVSAPFQAFQEFLLSKHITIILLLTGYYESIFNEFMVQWIA